jgi:hypothetical protein
MPLPRYRYVGMCPAAITSAWYKIGSLREGNKASQTDCSLLLARRRWLMAQRWQSAGLKWVPVLLVGWIAQMIHLSASI